MSPNGVPACWSWPVPPALDLPARRQNLADKLGFDLADPEDRGCVDLILDGDGGGLRLSQFHAGRCAICGQRPVDRHLVDDHCHKTGQIRGLLCRSCNTREGVSKGDLYIRYRRIHPAQILDIYEPYIGRDWVMGWWVGDCPNPYDLGPRPATPWQAWHRDDPLDQPCPR